MAPPRPCLLNRQECLHVIHRIVLKFSVSAWKPLKIYHDLLTNIQISGCRNNEKPRVFFGTEYQRRSGEGMNKTVHNKNQICSCIYIAILTTAIYSWNKNVQLFSNQISFERVLDVKLTSGRLLESRRTVLYIYGAHAQH